MLCNSRNPQFLLTGGPPSAAPGFYLSIQDVCLSSGHHFSIPAGKKEEENGWTPHSLLKGLLRSLT